MQIYGWIDRYLNLSTHKQDDRKDRRKYVDRQVEICINTYTKKDRQIFEAIIRCRIDL